MWTKTFLFLPYMAIGWRLVTSGWGGGVDCYPSFRCKFGGHSRLLCLWFSLRRRVFKLVGRPVRNTAASIPRGATQTAASVKELNLNWFEDLKLCLDLVNLAYRAAYLASVYDTSMIRCGDWRTGRACPLPVM
jgi:hypothetical protein